MGLGKAGRTVDQAAAAMRRSPGSVKTYAREFVIDFADYRPFARERDKGIDVEPRTLLACGPCE
jgi:hypothetical protein